MVWKNPVKAPVVKKSYSKSYCAWCLGGGGVHSEFFFPCKTGFHCISLIVKWLPQVSPNVWRSNDWFIIYSVLNKQNSAKFISC